MPRNVLLLVPLLATALIGGCGSGSGAPDAEPAPPAATPREAQPAPDGPPTDAGTASRSTRDGVYTVAQAERGEQLFTTACSACHAADEWSQAPFLGKWSGRSVRGLYSWIHDEMPSDEPGSLTDRQYADVLAFILRQSGLPAGGSELSAEEQALADIRIDWEAGR